eukprot:Amastigsp_a677667_92.p3 type:complete len:282 gc:universal Amastigsp_a677667_92:787-1632(+)
MSTMYFFSWAMIRSICVCDETITWFSMSVLGGESWNWIRAILASRTDCGPPALPRARRRVNTIPLTSSVSSTVPPWSLTTRTSRRSTETAFATSMTESTASTAIGARSGEYCDTTFDESDVIAAPMSASRSLRVIGVDMPRRTSTDLSQAIWKPCAIVDGWMPFSSRVSDCWSSAPARTTTDVVPSPASTSCARDTSTSILATGCTTAIFERIVAPSLVMITSPRPSSIILSMPRGPSDVRTASATAFAAIMLETRTSFSRSRSSNFIDLTGAAAAAAAAI